MCDSQYIHLYVVEAGIALGSLHVAPTNPTVRVCRHFGTRVAAMPEQSQALSSYKGHALVLTRLEPFRSCLDSGQEPLLQRHIRRHAYDNMST